MKTSLLSAICAMAFLLCACVDGTIDDEPASQTTFKDGLTALWEQCGGENWTVKGEKVVWDFDTFPSGWTGISLEDGLWCVDFYNAGIENVEGTIPESFWHRDIKRINFQGCSALSGKMPERFYEMLGLEYLNLSYTGIGGVLSPEIGRLKKLYLLNLDYCEFEGVIPEEIGTLDLDWCSMRGNYFESFPEFFRYRPTYHRAWDCGRGTDYPCIQRDKKSGALYFLPMPYWMAVKFNKELTARVSGYDKVFWLLAGTDYKKYPAALDLQYPADEYYYDGRDWRHPKYEHPARDYWFDGAGWTYEPGNPWTESIDTGEHYDSEGRYHFD